MATIQRTDGTFVIWDGEVEGPKQLLNALGQPERFVEFTTEIEFDGASREVIMRVETGAVSQLGAPGSVRDEVARACVVRYLQEWCENAQRKAPDDHEHVVIQPKQFVELRARVTEAPQKFVCTVEIPVRGGNSEMHEVELFDERNAVPMLRNRLPKGKRYDWEQATVLKKVPKK